MKPVDFPDGPEPGDLMVLVTSEKVQAPGWTELRPALWRRALAKILGRKTRGYWKEVG